MIGVEDVHGQAWPVLWDMADAGGGKGGRKPDGSWDTNWPLGLTKGKKKIDHVAQPYYSKLPMNHPAFFFASPPPTRLCLRRSFFRMRTRSRVPLPPSQKPFA